MQLYCWASGWFRIDTRKVFTLRVVYYWPRLPRGVVDLAWDNPSPHISWCKLRFPASRCSSVLSLLKCASAQREARCEAFSDLHFCRPTLLASRCCSVLLCKGALRSTQTLFRENKPQTQLLVCLKEGSVLSSMLPTLLSFSLPLPSVSACKAGIHPGQRRWHSCILCLGGTCAGSKQGEREQWVLIHAAAGDQLLAEPGAVWPFQLENPWVKSTCSKSLMNFAPWRFCDKENTRQAAPNFWKTLRHFCKLLHIFNSVPHYLLLNKVVINSL